MENKPQFLYVRVDCVRQ